MNLLSAVFGALTCGGVAWFLARATGSRVAAATGGLALAVSSTFWSVATVTEVYTLHLFLMTVGLCAALVVGHASHPRSRRVAMLVGAAALGLGLSHHPTIVVAVPAALILALPFERRSVPVPWLAASLLAIVAIPALFYLSLMLRAQADPAANWGDPSSFGALVSHAGANLYRHLDLGWAGLLRPEGWKRLGGILLGEFTPALLPVAAYGLVRGPRKIVAALSALIVAGTAFGLRYSVVDIQVFYLPVYLGLALAAGLAVVGLRRAGPYVAIAIVLAPALYHFEARNMRGATASIEYGRDVLDTVPDGGVLFVDSDDSFLLLYLLQVLGERPDVTVYGRNGNTFLDLADAPAGVVVSRGARIGLEQSFIDRELAAPRPRGVYFSGWPGYEVPPQYRMEPVGLLHRIVPATEPILDDGPIWAGYHENAVLRQGRRTGDGLTMAIASIYPTARGERALFLGDRETADAELEKSADLGGDLNYIGTLYGRIGDFSRAAEMFESVLELRPTSLRAWKNLAMARERGGDIEGARAALRGALDVLPGQVDVEAELRRLGGQSPSGTVP